MSQIFFYLSFYFFSPLLSRCDPKSVVTCIVFSDIHGLLKFYMHHLKRLRTLKLKSFSKNSKEPFSHIDCNCKEAEQRCTDYKFSENSKLMN